MSKLSFRARALDPSKHMPIYLAEELPDLPEYSAINRAVPQMPSGMEKEEEAEHHLQRAICTGLIIPTPEVFTTEKEFYDKYYPANYKMPRQLIHMQPLGLEQDVPEYDMDSADEAWVNLQCKRIDLTPLKFEQMMDRLERSSGQTVVTLNEAKSLLKQDDELSIAVYDYWLNKRLKMQHPLILSVKTENRPGVSSNNPYLAFRRRTEKMQTRKNRKNDETSYEKMLRLRRDLKTVTAILQMVKQRELKKVESVRLSMGVFERRVELKDYSNSIYTEVSSQVRPPKAPFSPMYPHQYNAVGGAVVGGNMIGGIPAIGGNVMNNNNAAGILANNNNNNNNNLASVSGGSGVHMYASTSSQYLNSSNLDASGGSNGNRKEKRQYKKRKHKLPRESKQQIPQQQQQQQLQQTQYLAGVGMIPTSAATAGVLAGSSVGLPAHLHNFHRQSSSPAANESNLDTEEEDASGNKMGSESEEETPFAFRRRANCVYQRPLANTGNWPWEAAEDDQGCCPDSKYRYTLTSLRYPRPRCIGFARRRVGRGGRVLLDRASTSLDDLWSKLDYTILENIKTPQTITTRDEEKTVIDLETINTQIPATQEKQKSENAVDVIDVGIDSDANANDAEEDSEDVENDMRYVSEISLRRQRGRHRKHRLSRRQLREVSKRRRKEQQLALQRLAQSLNERQFSIINSYLLNRKSKQLEDIPADVTQSTTIEDNVSRDVDNLIDAKSPLMPHIVNNHRTNNVLANINNKTNNNNNNKNSNNNNNKTNSSSSSGISNRQVNSSDKLNVIQQDMMADNAQVSSTNNPQLAMEIKEEILDVNVNSSGVAADDSNEPLSSLKANIEQSGAPIDVEDDEENVNLAQLCNLIKHTSSIRQFDNMMTKHDEVDSQLVDWLSDDDDNDNESFNQMVHNLSRKRRKVHSNNNHANIVVIDEPSPLSSPSSRPSSPSSTQRMDVCNALLAEIRQDWLHFRPKTPTKIDDDVNNDMTAIEGLPQLMDLECKLPMLEAQDGEWLTPPPLVEWSEQTPITVELLSLNTKSASDALYTTNPFKYDDLTSDAQLLEPTFARSPDAHRSAETSTSSCGVDLNVSGDSLSGLNLLDVDDAAADEQLLDNILEECQIDDDIKTNFWNGFLESTTVDGSTGADANVELIDVGGEKQKSTSTNHNNSSRLRAIARKTRNPQLLPVGHSSFNVVPVRTRLPDDIFFKKPKQIDELATPKTEEEIVVAKVANDKKNTMSAGTTSLFMATNINQPPPLATLHGTTIAGNVLLNMPTGVGPSVTTPLIPQQHHHQLANLSSTPMLITSSGKLTIPTGATQRILQQQQQQLQQQNPNVATTQFINVSPANVQLQRNNNNNNNNTINNNRLTLDGGNGNETIITLNSGNLVATTASPQQQQQQSQQPQQHALVQIQSTGHAGQTPQIRNVTMQQLQQLHQQQRQQQQMLLQMQRTDANNQPILTQFVSVNNNNNNNSTGTTAMRQQPTLTPIGGAATSGNHVMYTTTADGQKFYIQKAPGGGGGITLSNIKIESDNTSDNNNATSTLSTSTSGGTTTLSSSGVLRSQLAVVDGQQQHQTVNVGGTPLLVATSNVAPRNVQQHHQQQTQILQSSTAGGTQIVWRPINAGSGGNVQNVQNVLNAATTSQDVASMTVSGNKIVWTNRTSGNAATKRQLNGPESADLNKLFMNRKFSQRKVLSQQHQIQISKQLQQLQQQNQLNDDNVGGATNNNNNNNNSGITILDTTVVNATNQQQQPQQQQQQQPMQQQTLQKVQMQSGKLIKMSTFPLFVSDFQQQQQSQQQQQHQLQQQLPQQQLQKQKHHNNNNNSNHSGGTTIGSTGNHNYSLQPGTIITSQSTPGGNKFFLTTASAAAAAASGDLQPLVANTTNSAGIPQKIHLKDLQNANLKVNFLSSGSSSVDSTTKTLTITSQQQQQLLQQHHQQQQQQQQQPPQQQQHQKRILNIIGTTADGSGGTGATVSGVPTDNVNSKRVLYTSLLNVKSLQKNNATSSSGGNVGSSTGNVGGNGGQVHMQIGPNNISHALLRGRIANSQTIFTTNMRSVPMSVSNTSATSASITTTSNKNINSNNNNNNNTVQINVATNNNNNNSNNIMSSRTPSTITTTISQVTTTPTPLATTTTTPAASHTMNKESDFFNNDNSSSNSSSNYSGNNNNNNNNNIIIEKTTTTNELIENNAGYIVDGIVKNNNIDTTLAVSTSTSTSSSTATTSSISR